MKNTIRADKLLSSLGVDSRRNIEKILLKNNVLANGKKVFKPGDRILPTSDIVINGRKLHKPTLVYLVINKPKGYISTLKDEYERRNVVSLVKSKERVFPIGRLDKETEGLLLLTNDGELTNRLIHPRFHVPKVYELTVRGTPTRDQILNLRNGVQLEDGKTLPVIVSVLFKDANKTTLSVTLHEGKKRQIRRMCETLRINLLSLKRNEFGPIKLGKLTLGESRSLTNAELKLLKAT